MSRLLLLKNAPCNFGMLNKSILYNARAVSASCPAGFVSDGQEALLWERHSDKGLWAQWGIRFHYIGGSFARSESTNIRCDATGIHVVVTRSWGRALQGLLSETNRCVNQVMLIAYEVFAEDSTARSKRESPWVSRKQCSRMTGAMDPVFDVVSIFFELCALLAAIRAADWSGGVCSGCCYY
jgi:hypothetical protein